jgi:hypothetical protein
MSDCFFAATAMGQRLYVERADKRRTDGPSSFWLL